MFDPKALHHAYFIEGEREAVLASLDAFLSEGLGIVRAGHPDVHYAIYESFGIDEGRALQDMQSMRPVMGDRKVFIVSTGAITNEAQNSLLKVFEEPTTGTHFFVIAPTRRILLPTLRSRMVIIAHESAGLTGDAALSIDAKAFVKMSPKDRLAAVAGIIEEKDKAKAEGFLASLITELRGDSLEKAGPVRAHAVKEIVGLSAYLKDRAPSVKLVLERAALLDLG
ncbi:MAG: hypothetical protein Q8L64_05110 [bacterium]|nr:hypothetical protein [bacterium]